MSKEIAETMGQLKAGDLEMVYADPREDGMIYCTLRPRLGLRNATEAEIRGIVSMLVTHNADKAQQAQERPALVGWFVGMVLKSLKGCADPERVLAVCKTQLRIR
jgi:Glu-tRNA(Gln) amidotransferase subunit E-like FAD-binding protein